jgi:hypothetical protein
MVTARGYASACQIQAGEQFRARGEPPRLHALSNRPVDLCGQRYPTGTIEVNGVSHHSMVQSELPTSVLFMTEIGPHLLFYNRGTDPIQLQTLVGAAFSSKARLS